ncbi:phage tail sheath subtilisin-like domain-containing protein [bacterium]|nr:phage tail sheath subtilisin-like domain-containing protein [bacterium]
MAFQLSPGVLVREQDASSVVPGVGTTIGGFVGDFAWGPARELTSIGSENELVARFGKPAAATNVDFLTAASFLAYGSNLLVSREVGSAARNAVSSGTAVLIRNEDEYESSYSAGEGTVGPFAAKWAGTAGNSLKVSVADLGNFTATSVASITVTDGGSGYTSAPTVTITASPSSGGTAAATSDLAGGSAVDSITVVFPGFGYTSAPTITISGGGGSGATATATLSTAWTYASNFDFTPGTTTYGTNNNVSLDEMHVIVIDEDGVFTGIAGTVLEKFSGVSKIPGSKNDQNESNYYKDVINNQSQYIWFMDQVETTSTTLGESWGSSLATVQAAANSFYELLIDTVDTDAWSLTGGVDASPADADLQNSYILFANDEETDVSLIVAGQHSATVGDYIIDNVTDIRKDCLVFVSPQRASVVNNSGSEVTDIVAELASYTRSSFAVMDSGWKYMYDRYNDVYAWVPCNGDTAGTCVTTDLEADPWFSPAGVNRGQIKNAVKLAFNPKKSDRDTLYSAGVNPIVQSAAQGVVLFGDKTLLAKTSAFNRINVRRLFIVIEKAIATAAKFQLFEFNDAFTRAQFRSLVEPFLRDVQGRRGVYDFRVVCDETNNTGQVIDANEFRADIFIKPAKSINFITLTFVATRTGISFEELGA